MKKTLLFFLSIVWLALSISSCTQDYTCTCRIINGASDTTFTMLYDDTNRSSAEDLCGKMQQTWTAGTGTATCTLSQ